MNWPIVSTFLIASLFVCQVICQRRTSVRRNCTMEDLQRCMSFLTPVTEGNDSALPTTREELVQVCDNLRRGVKCIDSHTRECFSHEQTMVFKDLVSPAREFISQLCEEGPIQTEFLKHASCYRDISVDAEKCASKYKKAVSTSSDATNATSAQNTELSMRRSCCALREFVHCKYLHVGHDCGAKAEAFMKDHLGQMTNPIMERHCAAYTFGSEACRALLVQANSASRLREQVSLEPFFVFCIFLAAHHLGLPRHL